MISVAQPVSLRTLATAPAPAPSTPGAPVKSEHSVLKAVGAGIGTGIASTAVGIATTDAVLYASTLPASLVLNHAAAAGFDGLGALLYYFGWAQMGALPALAGALGVGIAAGVLATHEAPQTAGKVRAFFEKPAGALRDGAHEIAAAASLKDGLKAGAKAGWKAGQTVGGVAGGFEGAATGFALGSITLATLTASAPLGLVGALVAAAAGGFIGCQAGRYVGGALAAGVGAVAGAAGYGVHQLHK